MSVEHPLVQLAPHPAAREQAISTKRIEPRSVILRCPSYATVLLPGEKGHRCDLCLQMTTTLKKCSGCASYWYCNSTCQTFDWQLQHKLICKRYNQYVASPAHQKLEAHEKMDGILLSHLIATKAQESQQDKPSALGTFMSLLPGPNTHRLVVPPTCTSKDSTASQISEMYSRFGNNNFTVHSHFTSIAHGIFPLASRMFNHSCEPNSIVRYQFSEGEVPVVEIVAIRPIAPEEQICIPYLDPALLQTRQKIFQLTYGFDCDCPSCGQLNSIGPIPEAPKDEKGITNIAIQLHAAQSATNQISDLPAHLRCVLREEYITSLSEAFSKTSHEGEFETALRAGMALLDIYKLIYPANYPQIGLHLLEMAKTAWNGLVSSDSVDRHAILRVQGYLHSAHEIMSIIGAEGDKKGPLNEIQTLQDLLSSEM